MKDSTSAGASSPDSSNGANGSDSANMRTDSAAPKDTVYPRTDTNSYRKDKDTAKKDKK